MEYGIELMQLQPPIVVSNTNCATIAHLTCTAWW